MKNKNFLFGLLLALFIFTACSSDDDNTSQTGESGLLGVWHSVPNAIDDLTLEFTSNNRVHFTYHEFDDLIESGDWELNGNNLKIYWDEADEGNEIYYLEILELTDTNLKWKVNIDGDDYIESYVR